jgi:carboxypeptidase Q
MRLALSICLLAFLGLILAAPLAAQSSAQSSPPRERVHNDVVAKIKEEGKERSKVMETISFLTDVHGPRLTASPITRKAGEWAKGRLTEWGLENARLESWGTFGRGWTLESFTANLASPNFSPLVAFPKAWSPSLLTSVKSVPIYLDAKTEKDLDNYRGKLHRAIVLISPPREVKALFEAPAARQSDERLLALANSDGTSTGFRGRGGPGTPGGSSGTPGGSPGTPGGSSATPGGAPPAPGAGPPGSSAASSTGAPQQPRTPAEAAGQRSNTQIQTKKWDLCYEEGAAVVLEPAPGNGGTMFVSSATMPSRAAAADRNTPNTNPFSRGPRPWATNAPEIIPQMVLAVEHYNRLVRMVEKGAKPEVEIDLTTRYHTDDLTSFNVLAEIPGSDLKDEVVMLGGHFDSWHSGTGATDNAVGCGVALEAVRILQAIGAKPRRTIRIALWTGEEQGLLGSQAYVAEHFGKRIGGPTGTRGGTRGRGGEGGGQGSGGQAGGAQPGGAQPGGGRGGPPTRYELKPAHEKFCGYFNLDNGTGKVRGVYLQGNEAVRPIFRAWLAPFVEMGAATLTINNTGGTDHLSFDGVGLPGFQFIQDPLEYDTRTHHSSMDVYDRIQEEDVKQASIIMASFVYHAAMRDEKLPRKPLTGEVVPAQTRRDAVSPLTTQPASPTGAGSVGNGQTYPTKAASAEVFAFPRYKLAGPRYRGWVSPNKTLQLAAEGAVEDRWQERVELGCRLGLQPLQGVHLRLQRVQLCHDAALLR